MRRYAALRTVVILLLIGITVFVLMQVTQTHKKSEVDTQEAAPNFTLKLLNGKEISLDSLKGKPAMLTFWATWCGVCREELPQIQKVYEKYRGKGLEVLAIDIGETEATVTPLVKEYGLTFPVLLDQDKTVAEAYQVRSIPVTFFVDANGKIVQKRLGGMNMAEIENFIGFLLHGR